MNSMQDLAIDFRRVGVKAGGRDLLLDFDLSIDLGARFVILGPNGAGKTTLLTVLSGTVRPSSGQAVILSELLGRTDMRTLRRRIGLCGSSVIERLNGAMTVLQCVLSGIDQVFSPWWITSTAKDEARAHELLELVGLDPLSGRNFSLLSMGERQQVAIARALVSQPEILLLDEPSAGLDLGAREALVNRIERIAHNNPALTIGLVTHHLEEIPPAFDRIIGINSARKVVDGNKNALLTSSVVGEIFGIDVDVTRIGERFVAFARV